MKAPIYLRITVNGKKIAIATGHWIKLDEWDTKRHQVKGVSQNSASINNSLHAIKTKILQIQNSFTVAGSPNINVGVVKEMLLGDPSEKKSLLELFDYHNNQIQQQIGKGFRVGTHSQYVVTRNKIASFLKNTYKTDDLSLESLSHKFVTDFELYLKTVEGLSSNTAMKKIKQLKRVISIALANEWLVKSPFTNFKCTYRDPKREALTNTELGIITSKEFSTERLSTIRDVFLFGCYTGLRFSDIRKLNPSNIITKDDGEQMLIVDTFKTGDRVSIPLLKPALALISKYSNNPECLTKGYLFPVKSNQKTNEFLKEIGEITGLKKKLHFHLARHTFATTITLNNGVSLEAVGKMLGHTNSRSTQIYAKMSNERVSNEMSLVRSKIEANPLTVSKVTVS